MYKTVVVDDEKIVLEGLKKLVKWDEYGFELLSCYTDGIEGAKKIREIKPDFVISDIRMPGLDGLSMIEQIINDLPYTVFLIISGYTDFKYVKHALNLGVADYIEKPITVEKVTEVLERIRHLCKENMIKRENLKHISNMYKITLEKSILEIVYSDDNYRTCFMRLGEDQQSKITKITSVCAVSGFVKNYSLSYDMIIEKIFEKYFEPSSFTYLTIKKGETFTGVILCTDIGVNKANVYNLVEKCKITCSKSGVDITLGASQVYSSLDKLRCSYIESVKAIRYAIFKSSKDIYIYESNAYNYYFPAIKKFDKESIFKNLRLVDTEMVIQILKKYLSMLGENDLTPDIFSQECMKLVYKAMDEAKCIGYDIEYNAMNGMDPYEEVQHCRSFKEITDWTIYAFKQIMENMMTARENNIYRPITKITDYLQRNFHKDISLNNVAIDIGFNPAYLSTLFKEEMGISFVKYLTNLRLDYAKNLLAEGYKVVDVSKKCGYNNYRYFCDTFKKYNGMTPNEYKFYGSNNKIIK